MKKNEEKKWRAVWEKKKNETNGRKWENIIDGGKDGNFLELLF